MSAPIPKCPLRPGEPCNLCHPECHLGPQDCPVVSIVLEDPDLRTELHRRRRAYRNRMHPQTNSYQN